MLARILVTIVFHFYQSFVSAADVHRCDEGGGYTSCFTKRASDQERVVGRGCSDKGGPGQSLEGDCEAFQSGERTERYCYCPFYLCNKPETSIADKIKPTLLLLLLTGILSGT